MKEEELPLSHEDNDDIINNDNPDCSAASVCRRGSRNKQRKEKEKERTNAERKIKGEEGRKRGRGRRERNGDGVSEGGWWFRIGWPVRVM